MSRAIAGRKQLTWSNSLQELRKTLGEDDRTDEQIVQDELEGEDVAVIPSESWRTVEPRATELLSVTELHGAAGAHRWLDDLGVEWWTPTRLSDHLRRRE